MNIVLFGFMGVGKTTIGRLLSEEIGYKFIDVDEEITSTTGRQIKTIFELEGEAAFREIEKHVIKDISGGDQLVIACGGGAVLDSENVDNLKRNSKLVLLTADIDEIMTRTNNDDSRPLLNALDRREKAESILRHRMPLYLELADESVDTTGKTPRRVVKEIIKKMGK